MRPIKMTISPPIPPAKPMVNPAAKDLLFGMASCAATTVTEKLDNKQAPAKAKKIILNVPPEWEKPKNKGVAGFRP